MKTVIILALIGGVLLFVMTKNTEIVEKEKIFQREVKALELEPKNISQNKIILRTHPTKIVTINVGKDLNTTISRELILKAEVDNSEDDYQYIWKERGEVLGFGLNLKQSFTLGEHNLTCQIFDEDRLILEDNIMVTAWEYVNVTYFYFDTQADDYRLNKTEFYNHLDNLVLRFSEFYRKEFIYNEYGKVLEERAEYPENLNNNYTITNSYGNEGNLLSMEKVDDEGKILESHIYDEEGKEIVLEVNDEISNDTNLDKDTPKFIKTYNKDGNVTQIVSVNGLYIRKYKYKNGRVVYHQTIYPKGKNSRTTRYNQQGKEIYREYLRLDKEDNIRGRDVITKEYNNDGKVTMKERKYSLKEVLVQHTLEKWEYKDGKKVLEETEAFVGICPCTANIVKERRTYLYDENGSSMGSNYEYQREEDSELKKSKEPKTIRTYTNFLE